MARTALVTGGARGIGAAIARQWVAAGGRVVVGDVDDRAGRSLVEELGDAASYVGLDVTDERQVEAAFAYAEERCGPVDCLFDNAGLVGVTGRIEDTPLYDWESTMRVLLTGMFLGIKHAVRVMRPRGTGVIVCTASVASLRGGLGPHAYTAAKSGLRGLVESVAVEVAPYGLRINAVAPGGTVSSLSAALTGDGPDDLDAASRRLAAASSNRVPTTADDVAAAALFLAGPGAARINGTCLVVDGGDDVLSTKGRGYYS
jgi:NAD(P)-dependent dehydrogenase (short-subunit alcohol dehydrogenase family)